MRLVFIDRLSSGMVVARDVRIASSGIRHPLIKAGTALTPMMIHKLNLCGIRAIYIQDDAPSVAEPRSYIIDPVHLEMERPRSAIGETLRENAVESLHDLFGSLVSGDIHQSSQIVRHLDVVVEQLVQALDSNALVNIDDLKNYDEYTYHHSLSVAVLSIAIGQHFGFGKEELNALGKCAIMHDIGKTSVPIEIIQKTASLDNAEFSIVQGHASAGYEYLMRERIGGSRTWEGVLAHHEKMDGTGYPNRLAGNRIPIWSRIISVADVYDALTSNRPYRTPMQPGEAIEYIMGGVDSSFDYDVVTSFVKKVDLYPVGSILELSDGMLVLVVQSRSQSRPMVKDLASGELYDLASDQRFRSIVINRVISAEELLRMT